MKILNLWQFYLKCGGGGGGGGAIAGVDNFLKKWLKSPKNLAKCGKIIHHINASRRGELEDGA